MNIKTPCSIALIAALAIGTAHASCTYPKAPKKLPQGKSATLEEMTAAQKAVKEFDTAINDYVTCLQTENDAAVAQVSQRESDPKKAEAQTKKMNAALAKKQNAAIDADKALAERFNEQLRVYKARDANKG